MRESYGAGNVAGVMAGRGQADVAKEAKSAGRLAAQIRQIHSYISDIEMQQKNVDSALSRLLDPRAGPPNEEPGRAERVNPSTPTLESELHMIIDRLNQLHANVACQAEILSSAI